MSLCMLIWPCGNNPSRQNYVMRKAVYVKLARKFKKKGGKRLGLQNALEGHTLIIQVTSTTRCLLKAPVHCNSAPGREQPRAHASLGPLKF